MRDWLRRLRIRYRFWRAGMRQEEQIWWEDEHTHTGNVQLAVHELLHSQSFRCGFTPMDEDPHYPTECGL